MQEDTTKTELLDKMSQIQDNMQARLAAEYDRHLAWHAKRRNDLIAEVAVQRKPGILDRISSCDSREAASLMWHEFLDGSNSVSQKTINKANRLLSTLDFPLP